MKVVFYNKSISSYINSLGKDHKADIVKAIDLLEIFGHRIELPHSKSLGKGLFELRCLRTGTRLFYCFDGAKAVILHIIIKKQSKIPQKDLFLARKRQQQVAKI